MFIFFSWVFKTEKKDIAFGIIFRDADKKETPVMPSKRVSCQNFPEMGQFECQKIGTCKLRLFSKLRKDNHDNIRHFNDYI